MKLSQNRINVDHTPLQVSGSLTLTGGSLVQFFDGKYYTPNREGAPASPIMLTHNVDVVNPDLSTTGAILINPTTMFYENDVIISSSTSKYELSGDSLIVKKNTPADAVIVIKAVTSFVDPRTNRVYSREDSVTLRTLIKTEGQYQLNLSESGVVYLDAYRNPNTTITLTATLKQNSDNVTDFTGVVFKWLNKDGVDVVENELYANSLSPNRRTLTIDKTYINRESITCEVLIGEQMVANDTVTFVRKYNSFRTDIRIPELPLQPGVEILSCTLLAYDMAGQIDMDNAFVTTWFVNEWNIDRKMAYSSKAKVPVADLDMEDVNLSIYPDVKRKECFGALSSTGVIYTDKDNKVLTVLKIGK